MTERFFRPLDEGFPFVLHRGRSLRDLTVDSQSRRMRPYIEVVRQEAVNRNMLLLEYARSTGLVYNGNHMSKSEKGEVSKLLNKAGIESVDLSADPDPAEFVRMLRGIFKLVRSKELPIVKGKPVHFLILFHYSEHSIPETGQPGYLSPEQMIALELADSLANSLALRKSGHYIVFSEARSGGLDALLAKQLRLLELSQPDAKEKLLFLNALRARYPETQCELSDDAILNITANSPNSSIEELFMSAARTKRQLTAKVLAERKRTDISRLSEGTLEAVDTERIKGRKLVGRNVARPMEILTNAVDALQRGSNSAPRNLILCGAPSTGKTDMAIMAAAQGGIRAFSLNSPKSSYVGESERKTKLMLHTLRQQRGMGIIDELEMVLPMDRGNGQNNDSGVTNNLMGQLQQFLSDGSLAGKVALIATSNKPDSISGAMLSRWVVVPVLMPLRQDYALILESIVSSMTYNPPVIAPSQLATLGDLFYQDGTTPRELRESIAVAMNFIPGELSIDHVIFAAKNVIASGNRATYIHSDLTALQFTRSNALLPWWSVEDNRAQADYPFPDYIEAVLTNEKTIDVERLQNEIAKLAPYANV